jgi:hypothetical protein
MEVVSGKYAYMSPIFQIVGVIILGRKNDRTFEQNHACCAYNLYRYTPASCHVSPAFCIRNRLEIAI